MSTQMAKTNGNGGGSQAMQRATTPQNTLKSFLESKGVHAKLAEVAGKAMRPADLVRMTLMAASRNEKILQCTQQSILRSLLDAAALGIQPGGLMGRGYLVPRWNKYLRANECHFDPGWRGLVDIARRTGKVKRIEAHVVFAADHFRVRRTPLTTIEHEPSEVDDPGDIRCAYAVCEFTDGALQIEIVPRRDIDKIRGSSSSKTKDGDVVGPWKDWPEEMARKTAVRRLCKYLPYDPMLERALEAATAAESDDMIRDVEVDLTGGAPTKGQALASKIKAGQKGDSSPDVNEQAEASGGETGPTGDPEDTSDVAPSDNPDEGP